jgi:hypothetical protein
LAMRPIHPREYLRQEKERGFRIFRIRATEKVRLCV